jgi:anti-sigma factor ChrR (cupin superfamily)
MTSSIQESSGATDVTGTVTRPDGGSLVARPAASEWQADGATGFSYKPLFEDPGTGLRTVLMKVDAGALAPPHAHDNLEQVYVLEGEFHDEYRTYGPGDFIVRAPGAIHTGGSDSGALVLLVYSN